MQRRVDGNIGEETSLLISEQNVQHLVGFTCISLHRLHYYKRSV